MLQRRVVEIGSVLFVLAWLIVQEHGTYPSLFSRTISVEPLWKTLRFAGEIAKALGSAGLRAISKLVMLFLAALGAMLVRKGVLAIVSAGECWLRANPPTG